VSAILNDPSESVRYAYVERIWALAKGRKVSSEIRKDIKDKALHKRIRMDPELCKLYVELFQSGEPGVDEVLIRANIGLMGQFVKKFRFTDETLDWWQEARIGLLEGFARYEEGHGASPATFVRHYVHGYMYRAILDTAYVVRIPVHRYKKGSDTKRRRHVFTFTDMDEMNFWRTPSHGSLKEGFADNIRDENPLAEETLSDDNLQKAIPDVAELLLRGLPERNKAVMRMRYFTGMTLLEIGNLFDLSRERIRQIEEETLRWLRTKAQRLGANVNFHESFHDWINILVRACRDEDAVEAAEAAMDTPDEEVV
jgi:RNA polymerase sigma factor (sigma-70 family)